MRDIQVTPELVHDFWNHMTSKYQTLVKSKADADEMQLISQMLGALKVVDKTAFLSRFTTTIGRIIYVPFTVGVATETHSLWSQITTCVHEHQHVLQAQEVGEAMFFARYLLDSTWRATYEGAGYRTNLTMHYWKTGEAPKIEPYLEAIKSYGLGQPETAFFERYLRLSLPVITSGGVPDEAAQEALSWLQARV